MQVEIFGNLRIYVIQHDFDIGHYIYDDIATLEYCGI